MQRFVGVLWFDSFQYTALSADLINIVWKGLNMHRSCVSVTMYMYTYIRTDSIDIEDSYFDTYSFGNLWNISIIFYLFITTQPNRAYVITVWFQWSIHPHVQLVMVSISIFWPTTESISSYHALVFRKIWLTSQVATWRKTADFQIRMYSEVVCNVSFFMCSEFSNYLDHIEYISLVRQLFCQVFIVGKR